MGIMIGYEAIYWRDALLERPTDDSVKIVRTASGVWLGWHDSQVGWKLIDSDHRGSPPYYEFVDFWAHMPRGETSRDSQRLSDAYAAIEKTVEDAKNRTPHGCSWTNLVQPLIAWLDRWGHK